MSECAFCSEPVDTNDDETYHEVTSWVNGPKLDGPKLRDQTGRIAHKTCVERLIAGQAPDQPELFDGQPCRYCGMKINDCMNLGSGKPFDQYCCGNCEH